METMTPQALRIFSTRLYLSSRRQKHEVSEEELEEEFKQMADAYKMELDKVKELIGDKEKESLKQDIAVRKAADFVSDSAVEKL